MCTTVKTTVQSGGKKVYLTIFNDTVRSLKTSVIEPTAAINIKEVFNISSMQIVTVHVKAFVVGEPEEDRPKNIHCTWRVFNET